MTQFRWNPVTTAIRRDTVEGLEPAHLLQPPQVQLIVGPHMSVIT